MKTQYKFPDIENKKLSYSERNSPQAQKFVAPPLDDEFYAESYELRKAASTMTVAAIEWFRNNLTLLLERSILYYKKTTPFRCSVLGVAKVISI